MLASLALVVFSLAFAAAANFELSSAPKVCSSTVPVMQNGELVKTLCYLKQDLTHSQGNKMCEANGMRLYQPKSSPESWATLVAFGKSKFGRSSKAELFVSGRKNDQCKAFKTDGRLKDIKCTDKCHTLCEYLPKFNQVYCESFNDAAPQDNSVTFDFTGIASPKTCVYSTPIVDNTTILSVTSAVAKENIVSIVMDDTTNSAYFPFRLALNFPNLQALRADSCSIATLSPNTFKGLTKLKWIDLDSNQITTLDSNVFKEVPNLIRLDSDENPIEAISANLFTTTLPLLEILYLDDAGCISFDSEDQTLIPTALSNANTCTLL